jgi:hypothetical protein
MTLTPRPIPGCRAQVRVPEDWHVLPGTEAGLVAVEAVPGRFAASVTAVLERGQTEPPADPVASATALLVTPVVLDVRAGEGDAEVLLCHLAGGISATARQRQVVVDDGLLVLTVTAATSRWAEVADVADRILDSLEAAP